MEIDLGKVAAYIVRFPAKGSSKTQLIEPDPQKPIYLIVQSPPPFTDIVLVRNQAGTSTLVFTPRKDFENARPDLIDRYLNLTCTTDMVCFRDGQLWVFRTKPDHASMARILAADINGVGGAGAGLIWLSRPFRANLALHHQLHLARNDINYPGGNLE